MIRVGILTFHDAHNYGAVLQAYALKKYIQKIDGVDATVINYHHHNIPDGFPRKRKIEKITLSHIAKHIYSSKDHNLRWNKFNMFIRNLIDNKTEVYTCEEDLEKLNIDIWICGSDQIWNTDITRGFNKGFFLDFETDGKKVSYAVSMGIPKLEEKYEEQFKKSLNKIDCISVREETLREYAQGFTDKIVHKVVDPTLLLDAEEYDELIKENQIKEKYLLIYALGPDERLTKIANKIANNKGLKIIELNDFKKKNYFCEQISNAGPEEFVTLIKNADAVVTNSFHGTIFSIIFEKDFYIITRLNRNSRMENILSIVDMKDRLIENVEDIDNVKIQDYKKAKENLAKEAQFSKNFLNDALSSKKKVYLETKKQSACSGCTACMIACPKDAITMIEDREGFKYPQIDTDKCINCGLCLKICPNVEKNEKNNILEVHGVKHKNENERQTSRSGGVFVAISDYILNQNGIIYGAKQNKDFSVSHERATNQEERNWFKGSKYVQSDMNKIIEKVKEDLVNGKNVLFSGTDCQVAAVNKIIPEKYKENLYTCDLICHGVPSTRVYNDFLKYIEDEQGKKLKDFNFRDKSFGWNAHYETMIFEDDSKISTQYFRNLFYRHNILRPACYNCNYANTHRPADITLADFWGIDEINPEFNDDKGVSLVIINSEKGKELFDNIKNDLHIIDCTIEDCIKHTYTLNKPTPISEQRDEFWKDYEEHDFKYIIEKYAG